MLKATLRRLSSVTRQSYIKRAAAVRSPLFIGAAAALLMVGLAWIHHLSRSPDATSDKPAEPPVMTARLKEAAEQGSTSGNPAALEAPEFTPGEQGPVVPVDPAFAALVANLDQPGGSNVAIASEAVSAWQTNFQRLVQGGPGSARALRAFLEQHTNSVFTSEAWQALGYPSMRMAALDALRQIASPEAVAAERSLFGSTTVPRELAVLALGLEEAAPGQYREQELGATRALLQSSAVNESIDVAPLFEIFQRYGGESVIPDLEQAASKWPYYATITLANLPDGAGIPSLLRWADPANPSANRTITMEVLAQLAPENLDAKQALLAQVSANQIPANLWPYLISPLSGDRYFAADQVFSQYPHLQALDDLKTTHLNYGNQTLYSLPPDQNLVADAMNERAALIEELLKAAPDPAAKQVLERARDILISRSMRPVAQTQIAPESTR